MGCNFNFCSSSLFCPKAGAVVSGGLQGDVLWWLKAGPVSAALLCPLLEFRNWREAGKASSGLDAPLRRVGFAPPREFQGRIPGNQPQSRRTLRRSVWFIKSSRDLKDTSIPSLRKTGNFTRCFWCSNKREVIKALLRYLDTKHRKPKLRLR